ncbi:MAG: hypothetical protein CVU97_01330 [Firmicutes bacterium HGW-Firmicutes-21]|nr:MAG: hypothetical protein CVU97_01330 [Firmicutes bacterium HGW-Firmicutes-21]
MLYKKIISFSVVFSFLITLVSCSAARSDFLNYDNDSKESKAPSDIEIINTDISDEPIIPNITEDDALEIISNKFSEKKWVFNLQEGVILKNSVGRAYYVIQACYDTSDISEEHFTYTMGWFYVDVFTGDIYESSGEYLISLDTSEYFLFD